MDPETGKPGEAKNPDQGFLAKDAKMPLPLGKLFQPFPSFESKKDVRAEPQPGGHQEDKGDESEFDQDVLGEEREMEDMEEGSGEDLEKREKILRIKEAKLNLLRLKREKIQEEYARLMDEEIKLQELVQLKQRSLNQQRQLHQLRGQLDGINFTLKHSDLLEEDSSSFDIEDDQDLDSTLDISNTMKEVIGLDASGLDSVDLEVLGRVMEGNESFSTLSAGELSGDSDVENITDILQNRSGLISESPDGKLHRRKRAYRTRGHNARAERLDAKSGVISPRVGVKKIDPSTAAGQGKTMSEDSVRTKDLPSWGTKRANTHATAWVCRLCLEENGAVDVDCTLCGESRDPETVDLPGIPEQIRSQLLRKNIKQAWSEEVEDNEAIFRFGRLSPDGAVPTTGSEGVAVGSSAGVSGFGRHPDFQLEEEVDAEEEETLNTAFTSFGGTPNRDRLQAEGGGLRSSPMSDYTPDAVRNDASYDKDRYVEDDEDEDQVGEKAFRLSSEDEKDEPGRVEDDDDHDGGWSRREQDLHYKNRHLFSMEGIGSHAIDLEDVENDPLFSPRTPFVLGEEEVKFKARKRDDGRDCTTVAVRGQTTGNDSDGMEASQNDENTSPLGCLQKSGFDLSGSLRANHRSPSIVWRPGTSRAILPIGRWVEGQQSGEFTAWYVLDHLFSDSESLASANARNLALATQMYTNKSEAIGGVLGTLAGGVPLDTSTCAKWLTDEIFSRDPSDVTCEAVRWLCQALSLFQDDEGDIQQVSMSRMLGRLMEVPASMISLAFSRSCLQAHPHRQNGSLEDYILKHIYLELVRRCWGKLPRDLVNGEDGNNDEQLKFDEESGEHVLLPFDCEVREPVVDDLTILLELETNPQSLIKECAAWNEEKLQKHNERIEGYIEFLRCYKDRADEQLRSLEENSHFSILGANPDMTDAELKKCYQAAVIRAHPDKKGGSKERFQQVRDAYHAICRERKAKEKEGGKPEKEGEEGVKETAAQATAGEAAGTDAAVDSENVQTGGGSEPQDLEAEEEEKDDEEEDREEEEEEEQKDESLLRRIVGRSRRLLAFRVGADRPPACLVASGPEVETAAALSSTDGRTPMPRAPVRVGAAACQWPRGSR